MNIKYMKWHLVKKTERFVTLGLAVSSILLWSGCGGGSDAEDDSTPTSTPTQNNNNTPPPVSNTSFAPATVGGKVFQGHIGGTSINFQLALTGSGPGGTYVHSENGATLERGTFTYTKQSSTEAVLLISPN